MSLTSFVTQPDVRAKFQETFPLSRVRLEKRPLIEPLTKHYALVGTAFDYLLRFTLQHRYAHAVDKPWIAEQVTDTLYLSFGKTFGKEKARMALQFVQKAKQCHAQYLLNGILTDDLLHFVLLLAQIDPFFRAGVLYEPFGEVDLQDVEDLRHLFAVIPFESLTSQSLCLLNPTFGASSLVGGADVDLVLDGIMIDVKTTKFLQMKQEYINQLLGYYTLYRLGGVTGMPEGHVIRKLGIYFSRHGYLYTYPIEQFASEATFLDFSSWFARCARQYRPALGWAPKRLITSTRKKLMLIDGHALIQRAYLSMPETLTTKKGEAVNATFGFISMLIRALNEIKPEYIAVAFDRQLPTFRHQQFTSYKAHRPTLPENMRPQQFGRIREVVEAFGIPIYEKDGFEADDVLGTLACQATLLGMDTIIMTGDLDTLQLINEYVIVMAAKKGISEVTEYSIEEVQQHFGVSPEHIPDYKGLMGDILDNIPKVKGIGEKTAKKLLVEYGGDIENIFAHIDDLAPREQRLLSGKEADVRQSKYLATIVCDVPVQLDLEACRAGQINQKHIVALLSELEFRTLIEKISAINSVK